MPHIAFLHTQSALRKMWDIKAWTPKINVTSSSLPTIVKYCLKYVYVSPFKTVRMNATLWGPIVKFCPMITAWTLSINSRNCSQVTTLEVRHLNLIDRRVFFCWIRRQLQGSVWTLGIRFLFFLDQWNLRYYQCFGRLAGRENHFHLDSVMWTAADDVVSNGKVLEWVVAWKLELEALRDEIHWLHCTQYNYTTTVQRRVHTHTQTQDHRCVQLSHVLWCNNDRVALFECKWVKSLWILYEERW